MLGELVQLDVPTWVQYVVLVAGLLAAVRVIVGWLPLKFLRQQTNDYIDERIDGKLAPIIERQTTIAFDVEKILTQLSPNHGDSVHDDVKMIRATVTKLVED